VLVHVYASGGIKGIIAAGQRTIIKKSTSARQVECA
jgi:hypothetical protein